jgi:hypothetical protein
MREVYTIPMYHGTNLFVYSNLYANISRDSGGTFYIKDFTIR